jgi:hypothetical protein
MSLLRGVGSQVQMAHACNPSYSGGRDQEDLCSKPAWANNSMSPYLEKNATHTHTQTKKEREKEEIPHHWTRNFLPLKE